MHFNFLNSRGNAKRNAELIYFANARQLRDEGFDFYGYSLLVTDNWPDFNGDGVPPFRSRTSIGRSARPAGTDPLAFHLPGRRTPIY